MPRLFALDHNFPQPIVNALAEFQVDADLVRVDAIDPRMADLDDWELLLALHLDERPWDGLITTDNSMLRQPRELAVLMQTKLTLVIADATGHDPLKASGLLFAYLAGICKRTDPDVSQLWKLNAVDRPAENPWETFKRASLQVRAGVSVPESAEQLGHAPAMTLATYTHVIRELRGEPNMSAAHQIEAACREAPGRSGDADEKQAAGA